MLDKGHTVLYLSSSQLFKLLEQSRFDKENLTSNSRNILQAIYDSELLIIDDLGVEAMNTFVPTDLFNIINTRHLNHRSTIISTNIEMNDWAKLYSERIASRFIGNYVLYKFIGMDVRLYKKYRTNI